MLVIKAKIASNIDIISVSVDKLEQEVLMEASREWNVVPWGYVTEEGNASVNTYFSQVYGISLRLVGFL